MRLALVLTLTLLHTRFLKPIRVFEFVSSDENLYVMVYRSQSYDNIQKQDIYKLNWVPLEKTIEECAFFHSYMRQSGAPIKLESWVAPSSQYWRFVDSDNLGKGRLFVAKDMCCFPHDFLTANILHE
ncbi:unnamed protein product [Lactuca virosa]|uniref:Uncharacterized protein n=1 Tax=Lactuca virosa TaxID=75947 RepID=A0AAU9LRT2_9ASTR|nr:unnamed protein product [Lactuca virosa]